MSPEQCQGLSLDPRSDLYSLAVVVYELLAGRRLFVGDRAPAGISTRERVRWEQVNAAPLPLRSLNPAVPPPLEEAVLAGLAKDPADRPRDVEAFSNAIRLAVPEVSPEPLRIEEDAEGEPDQEPAPSRPTERRFPALPPAAWVMGGSLLAAFVLLVVLMAGGTDGPGSAPARPTTPPDTAPAVQIPPGYHPVGRAMGAQVSCAGQPFGTVQIRVEGVEVLASAELRLHVAYVWQVSNSERASCPEYNITIGSDAQNTNMYLTDELGNRYDHVRAGGAAAREKTMEPNVAQEGWFLFPAPRPGAQVLAFRDDDNGMAIVDIDLGP
jgi:hypothetical protein